jgi:hypothetical protein
MIQINWERLYFGSRASQMIKSKSLVPIVVEGTIFTLVLQTILRLTLLQDK